VLRDLKAVKSGVAERHVGASLMQSFAMIGSARPEVFASGSAYGTGEFALVPQPNPRLEVWQRVRKDEDGQLKSYLMVSQLNMVICMDGCNGPIDGAGVACRCAPVDPSDSSPSTVEPWCKAAAFEDIGYAP
jgi:hypothetical protein